MNRFVANQWLITYYEEKCRSRPGYSLRAFSKKINIPPGRVSEYFSKKRTISVLMAQKIVERLSLNEQQRIAFLESVKVQQPVKPKKVIKRGKKENKVKKFEARLLLSQDEFAMIADWYHYAILSLIELKSFKSNVNWISSRLNLNPIIAKSALQRLERLGLIEIKYNALEITEIKLLKNQLSTTEDISSSALKTSHEQSLKQSIEAIHGVPIELREIISATLIFKKEKISEAKNFIREFILKFGTEMETKDADEVYNINVQFVPVTNVLFKK